MKKTRPKTVFLDAATIGPSVSLDSFRTLPVELVLFDQTEPTQVVERLRDAEIAVTNKVLLGKSILDQLPHLKLICVIGTGMDCVDLEAAKAAKIEIRNVRGYSKASVSQMTLLMILSLATSFVPLIEDVKRGRWREKLFSADYPIVEVKGKTLGIIGYGDIGAEVGRLGEAFGMKPLIMTHYSKSIPGALPLADLLPRADFLTIHVPLTASTKHLIGEKELRSMKKTACLINVSRGGIIHEQALADALKQRIIHAAALDVLSQEPPPPDHPLLDPTIPNLLLTPHIAWASDTARDTLIVATRNNIKTFLESI